MNKFVAPLAVFALGLLLTFGDLKGCNSFPFPIQKNHPGATVMLLESNNPGEAEAIIRNDKFWTELESRNLKGALSSRLDDRGREYLGSNEPPQILILSAPNAEGKVTELFRGPLPASVAELNDVVKRETGQ